MRTSVLSALGWVVLWHASVANCGQVVLTYDAKITEFSTPAAQSAPATTSRPDDAPEPARGATQPTTRATTRTCKVKVTLGEDYVCVEQERTAAVYNFATKRCRILSDDNTYNDFSLYMHLGYRVAEIQNCLALRKVLQKSAERHPDAEWISVLDPFELASAFALKPPDRETFPDLDRVQGLTCREFQDGFQYDYGDGPIVRFVASKQDVPQAYRRVFSLYLVYNVPMHPDIRKRIEKPGKFPAKLDVRVKHAGKRVEMTLVSVELTGHDARSLPAGAKESPVGDVRLQEILDATKVSPQPPTEASVIQYAEESLKRGSPFDGFLALMEYMQQTGQESPSTEFEQEIRNVISLAGKDERYRPYFQQQSPRSKQGVEQQVQMLKSLDREGLGKAYVLDISQADAEQQLGLHEQAQEGFFKALKINPFIAGVYHDLGMSYYARYNMPEAWVCWDTGRRLAPQHGLLRGITVMEQRLEAQFPEYFLGSGAPGERGPSTRPASGVRARGSQPASGQ